MIPPGIFEASVRALLIGLCLAWVVPNVQRQLAAKRWLWWFVLTPLLTPPVVVAFAYVGWSPGTPATLQRELVYSVLLAARLLPVAAILQFVLPPPPASIATRSGAMSCDAMSSIVRPAISIVLDRSITCCLTTPERSTKVQHVLSLPPAATSTPIASARRGCSHNCSQRCVSIDLSSHASGTNLARDPS